MQHLDDGRLQEWVDRARSGLSADELDEVERHLAGCRVCMERVGYLTELDDRTQQLLSAGTPTELPDFAEVSGRAAGLETNRRRQRVFRGGAWAASLVIALGVGWVANEMSRRGPVATAEIAAVDDESAGGAGAAAPPAPPVAEAPRAPTTSVVADAGPSPTPPEPTTPRQADAASPQASPDPSTPVVADVAAPGVADAPAPVMADAGSPPTRADPGTAVEDAILERIAPEPTEPTVPDTRVVAGHVTDGTGSPLQAVQVFVEGTAIGTLTDAQGAFRLELPRGARADDPPPILVTQRIGYDGASREVIAGPGGTAVLDFSLSEQALSLDEIVVTGTSSAVRDRAVPGELTGASSASEAVRPEVTPEVVPGAEVTVGTETWTPRTRADAEALAGFAILTLPDRPIEDVAADVVDGVWVTRVVQRLEDGTAVVLLQSRRVIRAGEGLLVGGMATASSSRGEFFLMAIGAASTESLGVVLERAR